MQNSSEKCHSKRREMELKFSDDIQQKLKEKRQAKNKEILSNWRKKQKEKRANVNLQHLNHKLNHRHQI